MGFWFFFPAIPSENWPEGGEEKPQRPPMLKRGLVCFLLEIAWKISPRKLIARKNLGKNNQKNTKLNPLPSPNPLSLFLSPCANHKKKPQQEKAQTPRAARQSRGGMSLVPISANSAANPRQIHGKSATEGPCWDQELDAEGCSECFNNKAFQGKLNTDHNEEEEEDEEGGQGG